MHHCLRERQQQFLDAARGVVGERASNSVTPAAAMAVYRRAYRARLIDTLSSHYAATAAILGEAFVELASRFIETHPSQAPSLRDFGQAFPAFSNTALGGRQGQAVAELARFESLLRAAFDAGDRERCTLADLRRISVEAVPALSVVFHPSVRVFVTTWNVVEAWKAVAEGRSASVALAGPPSAWLIVRGEDRLTRFRSLRPGAAALVHALRGGESVAAACAAAIEAVPADEVTAIPVMVGRELEQLLEEGALVALG